MVGYSANKGIVPVTCEELFKGIDSSTEKETIFEVSFSMLEIYNENVSQQLTKTTPVFG